MNAISTIPLNEALNYLDILREFIIKDIPVAISGKANYLAALGLSTYTETLGGLYCGDLSGINKDLNKHYISFIEKFFNADYMKVNDKLKNVGLRGLYYVVRSGLTHEYFIKRISKIEMDNPPGQSLTCGITYDQSSDPQIVFYVKQYFDDFKNAFETYYSQLENDKTGLMLKNFEKALGSINSSLIGKLSKDFREDVSGRTAVI